VALPPAAAAPAPAEEKAEQMAEKVMLVLREFEITVTKDSIIINLKRTPGELTLKEWRVVKTFIDNILSEMRARPAR
jgi:hypothetical protein